VYVLVCSFTTTILHDIYMNKTIKWLDSICRCFICLLMLIYGLVKVFHGQFYTDYYWKDIPLGQLDGVKLVWSLYSYSPVYETPLGLIEVSIGLLVFFKRTTRLGVLLFLPIIINLLTINIIFSIGALPIVVSLWVAGIILFFINFKSYKNYFLQQKIEETLVVPPKHTNLIPNLAVMFVGVGLAALLIHSNKFRIKQDVAIKGPWVAEGYPEIKKIYFGKGYTCVVQDSDDSLFFGNYQTNLNKTITVEIKDIRLHWENLPYSINHDTLFINKDGKKLILLKKNLYN